MKLRTIDVKVIGDRTIDQYYLGDNYMVRCVTYGDGSRRFGVTGVGKYIPEIFYDDIGGERFVIQTTGYGALSPEEIQKVIAGYQEAVEAVETLKKEFGVG